MIKFANLEYIWIFGVIAVVIFLMYYSRKQSQQKLNKFAKNKLIVDLLENFSRRTKKIKQNLFVGALLFLSLALIGPQVGKDLQKVERKGVDILIAMDVSSSMEATDVSPSRLERAQYKVNNFIDRLQGDRIGLVAFAGISYLHCPLTLDYSAAKLFLDILDPGVIQTQGTDIAGAIKTGLGAFKKSSKKNRVILVISDGEDHQGELESVLEQAKQKNVTIYSIGVGTKSGAPIPIKNKAGKTVRYKKNTQGSIVTTKLEPQTLKKIAQQTSGKYAQLSDQSDAFAKIYKDILGLDKKKYDSYEYSDYKTRYQIFLGLGLVMLIASIYLNRNDQGGKNNETR